MFCAAYLIQEGDAIVKKRKLFIILAVVMCLLVNAVPTFAASGLGDDPNVIVISPTKDAVMKSGKVLVSVKMTAPKTIKMSFYEVTSSSAKSLIKSETYSSNKNLSYYTRQLTGLDPGVYCVNISTISSGKAIYASEIYIKVAKKTSNTVKVDVFNSQNTSTSFWSSLLKKLLD